MIESPSEQVYGEVLQVREETGEIALGLHSKGHRIVVASLAMIEQVHAPLEQGQVFQARIDDDGLYGLRFLSEQETADYLEIEGGD